MNFKFPSELRLLKTDDFSSVFNFRKRISATTLVIHYRNNPQPHPRLGLVVSKKVAKLSVDRNYMRRVLRERRQHFGARSRPVAREKVKFLRVQLEVVSMAE